MVIREGPSGERLTVPRPCCRTGAPHAPLLGSGLVTSDGGCAMRRRLQPDLPAEVGKALKEQNQRLDVLSSRLKVDVYRKVESA